MLLSEFVSVYAGEHDIAAGTIGQYLLAAQAFEKSAGPQEIGEITPDAINQHIRQLKEAGRADSTRRSRRSLRNSSRRFTFTSSLTSSITGSTSR